jgi:hypothetical protein
MGSLIKGKPKESLVPKLIEENYPKPDVSKPILFDKPELSPIVSPDTDVVNDGVNKQMKKGKASTIMTGMLGDTSKANTYSKSLLGS